MSFLWVSCEFHMNIKYVSNAFQMNFKGVSNVFHVCVSIYIPNEFLKNYLSLSVSLSRQLKILLGTFEYEEAGPSKALECLLYCMNFSRQRYSLHTCIALNECWMAKARTKMSTLWKQLKTQLFLIGPWIAFDVLLRIFYFETITIIHFSFGEKKSFIFSSLCSFDFVYIKSGSMLLLYWLYY